MVWYLLLAHFIADFPLQSDWMVRAKTRVSVLAVHVTIHLLVTLAIVGSARIVLFPYFITLAAIHFGVDLTKNFVNLRKPHWVILPYIADQAIHYVSIVVVAIWIRSQVEGIRLPVEPIWVIYGLGFLLVTYVWFISERIFAYKDVEYKKELTDQFLPRMIVRAGIVGLLLVGLNTVPRLFASGVTITLPYLSGQHWRRAIATDILVSMVVVLLIQFAVQM